MWVFCRKLATHALWLNVRVMPCNFFFFPRSLWNLREANWAPGCPSYQVVRREATAHRSMSVFTSLCFFTKRKFMSPLYTILSHVWHFIENLLLGIMTNLVLSIEEAEECRKQISFVDFGTDRVRSKACNLVIKKWSHFIKEIRTQCVWYILCTSPSTVDKSLIWLLKYLIGREIKKIYCHKFRTLSSGIYMVISKRNKHTLDQEWKSDFQL